MKPAVYLVHFGRKGDSIDSVLAIIIQENRFSRLKILDSFQVRGFFNLKFNYCSIFFLFTVLN